MELKEIIRNKHSGDKEQLDFIFSPEGRVIVTAPAGCGKTTAMVSKIAWELSQGSIPANKKILAMTFSVPAATKIKDAVNDLLPNLIEKCDREINKVIVANYHNFAAKLIYKHGYFLDQELVKMSEFIITGEYDDILNNYLTSSQLITIKELDTAVKNLDYDSVKKLAGSYYKILKDGLFPNHVITYNGLLMCATKLLGIKSIKNFYRRYFSIIIIDEFQDTNYLSFKLINKLIGDNKIFLLGDDIQKIYGFLGAIENIFPAYKDHYNMKEIMFLNNYRFAENSKMKKLDKFIRGYGTTYAASKETAKINVKILDNETKEAEFILAGIKKILSSTENAAILVRAGYQSEFIVDSFEHNHIPYFNAIFNDNDAEYIKFHEVALNCFIAATSGKSKATKSAMEKCKNEIESYKSEICPDSNKDYIFDSLRKLLDALFVQALTRCHSAQERYEKVVFVLSNNSLRHMMEYIEERVVITTIHSAKGLEWDYVIIPKVMCSQFPPYYGVCKPCQRSGSRNKGHKHCEFTFGSSMERKFNEEISVFYVAITRAKKDVYITANTGKNGYGYYNQTSCLINLPGLICEDFNWI